MFGGNISLANISDMKMVSSTSFTATDVASIYPKFEFMNSGGKIEQIALNIIIIFQIFNFKFRI